MGLVPGLPWRYVLAPRPDSSSRQILNLCLLLRSLVSCLILH